MQYIGVTTWANNVCYEKQDFQTRKLIHDETVCALPLADRRAICHGDLGSPMILDDKVVGLAGWVHEFCPDRTPQGYTRVSSHLKWIQEVSGISPPAKTSN